MNCKLEINAITIIQVVKLKLFKKNTIFDTIFHFAENKNSQKIKTLHLVFLFCFIFPT